MKLTTRFFIILLMIAVIPLLLSVAWNIYQYNSSVTSYYDLHKGISSLTAANIDEWLAGTNRDLAFLYEVEHPLAKKVDDIKIIHQATRINSEIMSLSVLAPDNKELYFLQSEKVKADRPLASYQDALVKQVRESGIIAPGKVLCLKSRAYFPLAYPMVDGRVVVFHFSLDKLFSKLNSQKIGRTGEVIITDSRGQPLPCQRVDRQKFDAAALRLFFRNGGRNGTINGFIVNGESYAGAYSAVENIKWAALSIQSEDELFGQQKKSIYVFALFAVGTFATTIVVVMLISNRIIRPINNMVNGVKKFLKDKHLDEVIPAEGWPEIKSLVGILNRLMLELQAYRAFQLNQIVEEKNKAQALIDTITDGVILVDDRGGLIYSNQTALKLLGIARISADVVLPRSIKNEAFFAQFSGLLASKEKFVKAEMDAPVPGASPPLVNSYRIITNQFLLATLKRPGRVIIMRDITNEKELEKAKEDFFHMITHDMRAPLATIQGYVEMLMRKVPASPNTDKYFKSMLYSSRRLRGMIDDILNTTKLQHGTMALQIDKISANDLITRIRDNHEPVATPKNIKMATAPSAENLEFYGDAALLERIITNLVGNSLKFTPSGGSITLGTAQDAEKVFFWVQDTGVGIPADKKDTIFEKYSQMEEHKSQGFGLGLAMCKMTVELHQGGIWVESEVGKGSKFIFTVSKKLSPPDEGKPGDAGVKRAGAEKA
ncbi:MAG: PAS domain-containing protein [Elusimicrobia bacterium]|nr:PAS domain-containing protein [Elusimicrobiota bacterium]